MRRRDSLTAHNERMKLGATTANALGLAVVAVGILRPLFDGETGFRWSFAVYALIAVALHVLAHYIVSQVETDT